MPYRCVAKPPKLSFEESRFLCWTPLFLRLHPKSCRSSALAYSAQVHRPTQRIIRERDQMPVAKAGWRRRESVDELLHTRFSTHSIRASANRDQELRIWIGDELWKEFPFAFVPWTGGPIPRLPGEEPLRRATLQKSTCRIRQLFGYLQPAILHFPASGHRHMSRFGSPNLEPASPPHRKKFRHAVD